MASILERNTKQKPVKKTHSDYAEDALYREVWEDVNNEKTQRFIKKYSRYLIAGALSIMILATAIQLGIHAHQANKIAMAQNYEAAIMKADANALAAMAENASGGTADLALFQAYMLDNDFAKLEKLANDGKTRDFRDLAKMHIVGKKGDAMSGAEIEEYLSDLDSKKSPFFYSASLTVAQKYLSEGNADKANLWLDKIINDKNAPAVISASAQALK